MIGGGGRRAALLLVAGALLGGPWRLGAASGPANVVLITLDTTRADHLGSYGYGLAATPELDALARHAGVPADKARITLANLRREGVACSWRSDIPVCPAKRRVGRPPVVYGPQAAIDGGSLDALAFVRQAWR